MDKNFEDTEDLLSDESFLAWYFKSNDKDVLAWDAYMKEHPQRVAIVEEAFRMLEMIRLTDIVVPSLQVEVAEKRLINKITDGRDVVIPVHRNTQWMIAIASLVLIFFAIKEYLNYYATPSIKTAYGEIKERKLPDGSQVALNAHTNLTLSRNWGRGKDREVWVDGEAYFHVPKVDQNSRFIVHTARFDVIVTGTTFNVVNRNEKANVFLKEGSLIIHPNNFNYTEILVKPGDLVEFGSMQIETRTVPDDRVFAWKERKFVFENTGIKQIGALMEEYYGVKVVVPRNADSANPVTGIFANKNLDVFLEALQARSHFKIIRTKDQIIIR